MVKYDSFKEPGGAMIEEELSDCDLEAVVGGLSRVLLPRHEIQEPVLVETAPEPE